MRGSTSSVWNYFTKVDKISKKATCNSCNNCLSYKTTTTNLKHHLKYKHYDLYEEVRREDAKSANESEHEEESLRRSSHGEEEVIYEYIVENSNQSDSNTDNEETVKETFTEHTVPAKRQQRNSRSSLTSKQRLNSRNGTGISKNKNIIEQLTAEKMAVTLLQKQLIEKELEEKDLKILLLHKEIRHKDMLHELQKEDMLLKIEISKANLLELKKRNPNPDPVST